MPSATSGKRPPTKVSFPALANATRVLKVARIQKALLEWYRAAGRAHLPWRTVRDPYRTLVSEFMLQQTQVDRVVPKFESFLALYPDFAALARASIADVLRAWKGLGYNSRALRLKRVAEAVAVKYGGTMPHDRQALLALPGIGAYTAAAIRAFAYDLDDAPVDTNVRRIVHRLALGIEHPARAKAAELDGLARSLVPAESAHDWSSAMMDLGATICTARAPKCLLCPLQPECAAAPIDGAALQRAREGAGVSRKPAVPFERTARFARGRVIDRLRELPPGLRISLLDLHRELELPGRTLDDMRTLVTALERDGLVACEDERLSLAD